MASYEVLIGHAGIKRGKKIEIDDPDDPRIDAGIVRYIDEPQEESLPEPLVPPVTNLPVSTMPGWLSDTANPTLAEDGVDVDGPDNDPADDLG